MTRQGMISIGALVSCHQMTRGELLQLMEWIRRYPDLLDAGEGMLYLESAMVAARIVRGGFIEALQPPAA